MPRQAITCIGDAAPRDIQHGRRVKGEVTYIHDYKGYGFVQTEKGRRVFVHKEHFPQFDTANPGARVSFKIRPSTRARGKVEAVRVREL